ncbi:uncharacterized protein LOC107461596 [Arachis duranensis]|uniref:Uncharacterized protein LOC107461596 n=1 Tax=Arachis duranensis TaxID=130453 RepID=A0A6P4BCK5_ARADU|nr:uncharacterized protein LOC107461596 [Arachis duranensis]XP_025613920.1 GATA zinc finger domain-containing protein 7 [Arachis hypogaea]
MAHQQDIEGWPLGLLQPLNNARSGNNSGSISFNTLLTSSSTTDNNSSSDLDTESTGSFYVDNSTTLGSLMGVSTISELSRRAPNNKTEQGLNKIKKQNNNRFSFMISRLLCPSSSSRTRNTKNNNNNNSNNDGPSLGEYLAVERTSNKPIIYYGPDDEVALAETIHIAEPNSLFVNGTIAPPPTNNNNNNKKKKRFRTSLLELFSCVCGPSLA